MKEQTYIDLDLAFDKINAMIFHGSLRKDSVSMYYDTLKEHTFGQCRISYKKRRGSKTMTDVRYAIVVDDKGRDEMSQLNTFCHELCHLWMYQHGYVNHGHNFKWQAIAEYCNEFGFNITHHSAYENNVHVERDVCNVYKFNGKEITNI